MTKSVTKVQDKDTNKRLSVVRSKEDPTKYWVVILNPDGSQIRWPKGEKGDAATINVGSTTTWQPWTDASVVNSWTTSDAVLDFTIPRGDKWETGTAATIAVWTTTTWAAGTCASVCNSWTSSAAVFDFTIPKGDKGDTWEKGDTWDDATVAVGTTCTWNPWTEASVTNSWTPGAAVFNFTIPQWVKGDKWDAATIAVGSTTTWSAGSCACVSNSGTSSAAIFDFKIPKGDKGDTGTAATINVWTTTTLAAWSCATVSNSGTTWAAIFNFGIPKGDKWDKWDTWNTWAAATIAAWTTTTLCAGCSANVTNSWTSSAAVFDFEIPKWDKWDKWDTGTAATIAVGTTTTLNPWCNATVSNSGTSGAAVFNFWIPKGQKWDTWTAATVTAWVTTTLAPWCNATVTNSGTTSAAIFDFGVPQWEKGDKWDTWTAATVSIWTTTTLNPWCCATVSNSGTSSAAVFNFGIPKWEKGEQWVQWETWEDGNWISCVTCEKIGKITTVTIYETNGCNCAFSVCDWEDWEWSGDVLWPSVSTNNHVVLFDGTSWKLIKDSGKNLPNVVDCLCSTSTTDALSAAQGKALNDKIADLQALGKFLSLWDSTTWLPISFPQGIPYSYSTWDYFLVETIGATNYRPTGSSYTGTASTTVETDEVEVWDMYIYDGSIWLLQINHWKTVSFANLSGEPDDNACLCAALSSKANSSSLCAVATSGKYCDLTGQPTKLSCFTNDSWYTTCTGTLVASDLNDYAKSADVIKCKSTTWSQTVCTTASWCTTAFWVKSNATSSYISLNNCTWWLASIWATSDKKPTWYNGTWHTLAYTEDIPTDNCQLANSCWYTTCTWTLTASNISDTAYWSSWDGVTTVAPSKNAVYDKIQSVISSIPTNNNQLTNWCWYTTCTGTLTSADIANLAQCCDIPSDNCQLANGCWYITSSALSCYAQCCDIPTDNCQLANTCGYITWINCTAVTNALGYTPYNWTTNPNWYITISSVPTDNCELSNGCWYITSSALSWYALTTDIPTDNCQLANSCGYTTCTGTLVASDLNWYAKCTDIPTDNSQLANSCGYITSSSLPGKATASALWTIKLWSDTTQSCTAEWVSCVANRTYSVQMNSSCQAVVNVPWENTQCVTSVNSQTWAVTLSIPTVSDAAYGSGWDGNLDAPTKNAIYDVLWDVNTLLANI